MFHLLKRLRARLRNRDFDADLAEELRFHEEMKRQELQGAGLPGGDARAAARRALGNVTLMREESRGVWIAPWLDSIAQDVRYALRTFVRQPVHTLTAGTVLVLAIGLNAGLFTLFKAMALEPWPVRDARNVVKIWARTDGRPVGPSVDEYRFIREQARSFAGLVAHASIYPARVRADGVPEVSLRASWGSANFFDVLGVRMLHGGGFIADDEVPGNRRAPVVLAYTAWRNHFAGDPGIVGRDLFVSGKPFTVVGVLDPAFDGNGREVDVWMPLSALSTVRPSDGIAWEPSTGSGRCCVAMVGRLAPGVDQRQAEQELQVLHERFAASRQRKGGRILLYGTAELSAPGRQRFALLGAFGGAVALVLVLACANVGNLQLARGLARRREIATRLSIGASRGRIVRQLLTEGLVLACVSGAMAVGVAIALPRIVFRAVDEDIPPYILARLAPDAVVLLFVLAVCVAACLAFALAPALHATKMTIPLGALDRSSTRPARFHLRSLLLATQIATCTVLLAGAGLVTRAIAHAMALDPGFRVDGVDVVSLEFPRGVSVKEREAVTLRALDAVAGGETAVALAELAPFSDTRFVMFTVLPPRSTTEFEAILRRPVSRRFFEVLGIPLARGRTFADGSSDEAMVNEAFARTYVRGEEAVGRTIHDVDPRGTVRRTLTIVGVVRNTHLTGLQKIDPVIFTPARSGMFLTNGGPAMVERIRTAMQAIDPNVTLTREPLRASVRKYLEESRLAAAFAWGIGLLGLALAMVGVFGVFAYSVEERRREIGVRLALGAARAQIVGMLVSTSGRAMIAGLAVGVLLSFGSGPVLRSYLFGLSPLDPLAYGMAISLLAGAAVLATLVPARRACRVDPAVTLREE